MGKGHKNKGKQGQKPNNKFKQRSAENLKELAKLQNIKGRSQSKNQKQTNKRGRNQSFQNKKSGYKNQGMNKQHNKRFSKNQHSASRQNSRQRNFSSSKNNQNSFIPKTKQINKKGKQFNNKFPSDQQDQYAPQQQNNNQPPKLKGNPLFQIIPEGMDDQFAALGQDQQEYDNDDINEYDQEGQDEEQYQEFDGEDGEEEEMDGEEEDGQEYDEEEGVQYEEGQGEEYDQEEEEQDEGEFKEGEEGQEAGQQAQEALQGQEEEGEEQQMMEQQQNDQKEPVDISVINLKIQQTIQILMNVQKLGGGKPRKHFVEELKKLVHQYYGYNFELITHFLDFFNPSEMIQFFEANETQRPLTIRTNTLKTRRKQLAQNLIQRGVNLDPLAEWSKVGIKIYDTKVPIGATPEYLAGHYMLQSASSLLPVIALDPQVGQKILDMASAPGGKTTYIAQLMKNTGCIFANDLKKERLRALQFNLYRLGVTNTAVTCRDGRKFPAIFPGTFDRVLLDAPCTGLGIISKDLSIKANRLMIDIYKNSHLQKQLLLAAIDCCKVNGVVVYSTCSISPLENEQVVNYALKKRFIKIVECEVQVGQQGLTKFVEKRFHVDLKKTRRIYPHVHNMDGFYVAKLIKIGKGKRQTKQDQQEKQQSKIMQNEGQQIQENQVDV